MATNSLASFSKSWRSSSLTIPDSIWHSSQNTVSSVRLPGNSRQPKYLTGAAVCRGSTHLEPWQALKQTHDAEREPLGPNPKLLLPTGLHRFFRSPDDPI